MSETSAPFRLSKDRSITMPLALLATLLAAVAVGYAALNSTRDQVARNTNDISSLQIKVASDHDVLVEINTNVKRLLREEGKKP